MRTYHIHIKAETAEEVEQELKELAAIMTGLRDTTKKWQTWFGSQNRANMRYWEGKADAWINRHKVLNPEETKTTDPCSNTSPSASR